MPRGIAEEPRAPRGSSYPALSPHGGWDTWPVLCGGCRWEWSACGLPAEPHGRTLARGRQCVAEHGSERCQLLPRGNTSIRVCLHGFCSDSAPACSHPASVCTTEKHEVWDCRVRVYFGPCKCKTKAPKANSSLGFYCASALLFCKLLCCTRAPSPTSTQHGWESRTGRSEHLPGCSTPGGEERALGGRRETPHLRPGQGKAPGEDER